MGKTENEFFAKAGNHPNPRARMPIILAIAGVIIISALVYLKIRESQVPSVQVHTNSVMSPANTSVATTDESRHIKEFISQRDRAAYAVALTKQACFELNNCPEGPVAMFIGGSLYPEQYAKLGTQWRSEIDLESLIYLLRDRIISSPVFSEELRDALGRQQVYYLAHGELSAIQPDRARYDRLTKDGKQFFMKAISQLRSKSEKFEKNAQEIEKW